MENGLYDRPPRHVILSYAKDLLFAAYALGIKQILRGAQNDIVTVVVNIENLEKY